MIKKIVEQYKKSFWPSNCIHIHPGVDDKVKSTAKKFQGGVLKCHCRLHTVEVEVKGQCAHNHVCGCSKCWKPDGALFSQIAVVPKDNVKVTSNQSNLYVVDNNAEIKRYACEYCKVHMYGRIDNETHPFYGLDFIHPELSSEHGWAEPEFAAFVSSIIGTGTNPADMEAIRDQLESMGLEPYDCFSPALMDVIATHTATSTTN